ncbi:MAG: DnaJ domain-containing protein [Candidatus Gastranaerophilales bacterium]|nr:DnaJ domain-containing protein [Candidatus Gastranaerophilales bacterium]
MLKSYYEILNVSPNATKSEIKSQFKKLAKMYHPDVNSSLEAEQVFKEINKAAQVLLDDEKRKNYDNLRSFNKENFKKSYTSSASSQYTFNDLFKTKQKPHKEKEKPKNKPIKGDNITVNVEIDYTEALLGTQRSVNVVHSVICPKCLGHKFANGQKCPYCDGLGEKISNKKITVKIPKGLKNGAKLRIKGEGKSGQFGGENGNLYVIVNIEKNDELKIKDGIVYYSANISPYMAVLGGNINVPTLWGEATIKIPPLTKTNQSFKLIDVGVLDEKTNKKGEQIVKILIQIPTEISSQEYLLYEKLRELNLNKTNGRTLYN